MQRERVQLAACTSQHALRHALVGSVICLVTLSLVQLCQLVRRCIGRPWCRTDPAGNRHSRVIQQALKVLAMLTLQLRIDLAACRAWSSVSHSCHPLYAIPFHCAALQPSTNRRPPQAVNKSWSSFKYFTIKWRNASRQTDL